jgi:hypothetical protein
VNFHYEREREDEKAGEGSLIKLNKL